MLLLITVLCAQVLANQVAGNKEDIDNSINTACIDDGGSFNIVWLLASGVCLQCIQVANFIQ